MAAKVPHAWDEAAEKLQWCQPFVQLPPNDTALTALQGIGATDKHREIVLCASALLSISAISPDLGPDGGMTMMAAHPGPAVEVGKPGVLGMVYRHTGEMNEEELVRWGPGVELAQPPDPTIVFDFRANDNSHVQIDAIPHLIEHVGHVLERFSDLKTPAVLRVRARAGRTSAGSPTPPRTSPRDPSGRQRDTGGAVPGTVASSELLKEPHGPTGGPTAGSEGGYCREGGSADFWAQQARKPRGLGPTVHTPPSTHRAKPQLRAMTAVNSATRPYMHRALHDMAYCHAPLSIPRYR